MNTIIRYKFTIIGLVTGAIAGYAYYYFVGCAGGTCAITSNPLNSTAYGALMGTLIFTGFRKEKAGNKKRENEH